MPGFYIPYKVPMFDKDGTVNRPWAELFENINQLLEGLTFENVSGVITLAQLVAHASTHQSGGSDAIQLDNLAAPDDNTDLDATIARHGLLPKLSGNAAHTLKGNGTWS